MIQWVHERARDAGASRVLVATDDENIAAAVAAFGGEVAMTRADHASGTDRLAEVAANLGLDARHVVVNLQGDEPCMPSELIRGVAETLAHNYDAEIATLASQIVRPTEVFDPNVVKVVMDARGRALYFSRAPIPYVRGHYDTARSRDVLPSTPVWRHVGLYAYRAGTLQALASLPQAEIERAESLEQLRALDAGIGIYVFTTLSELGPGVDVPEDVARAEAWLAALRTP
jgi:3-deoxy-manno-octulosonate cytidylyltransferase (CMP-KDO synthetase)